MYIHLLLSTLHSTPLHSPPPLNPTPTPTPNPNPTPLDLNRTPSSLSLSLPSLARTPSPFSRYHLERAKRNPVLPTRSLAMTFRGLLPSFRRGPGQPPGSRNFSRSGKDGRALLRRGSREYWNLRARQRLSSQRGSNGRMSRERAFVQPQPQSQPQPQPAPGAPPAQPRLFPLGAPAPLIFFPFFRAVAGR